MKKFFKLCIVGNMLGRNPGYVTTQGQIVGDLLAREGYSVITVSSKVNRLLRLLDILLTVVRNRRETDILILEVYSGLYFWVAEIVGRVARYYALPTIFVLHGGNLPQFSVRHIRSVTRALQRADIMIAPSGFLARELKHLGLPIKVIPNVCGLADQSFTLRRSVQPRLLWMRAFHDIYNPAMAVDVFESVKRKFPKATLVMAGVDKGLEPEIKKLVLEKGLQDAVTFPGFLDHEAKIQEFSRADIFLNTNRVDNMPVAVVEACAMGLPVVATCVGGIPDLLRNGEDGLLVPDRDVESMADAVCSLIENPELAERLSRNGRLLAEKSAWERVRLEWEKLFAEVLQSGRREVRVTEQGQFSNP